MERRAREEEHTRRIVERGEIEFAGLEKQLNRIRQDEIKRHNAAMAAIEEQIRSMGFEIK